MPGPPPNPNSARSKSRGLTILTTGPDSPPPPPPSGLTKAIREAWLTFWGSPLRMHVIESDLPAMRRLFQMYDRRERFDKLGMEEPLVMGSQNQLVLSAYLKEVDVLDAKILALEDRFGMSPMARLKLQVQVGDASRSIAEANARLGNPDPVEADDDQPDPRLAVAR